MSRLQEKAPKGMLLLPNNLNYQEDFDRYNGSVYQSWYDKADDGSQLFRLICQTGWVLNMFIARSQ
jgi:hypothetical protein